jgi:pimeloyl-ACP methyl ester carboxylesterase
MGFVLFVTFIAGFFYKSEIHKPDLHRLYMETLELTDHPPVVFIHGVLGSKLRDVKEGNDLWLGPVNRILFSDYAEVAYDIDPETLEPLPSVAEAYAISDSAVGKDFYGKIVNTLRDTGGYRLANIGERVNPNQKNYYVFHYDWRQDNVITARHFSDYIDQIRIDYGDPDLKVDIVAHSMGGLITRYYIRYGGQDVIGDNDFDEKINMYGGDRVRRVILLGTPNLGSIKTLFRFITGVKIGFKSIGTETLMTMPSLYQLFPHPLNDWILSSDGTPLDRDIYDINIWKRFQWSIFSPEARERILNKFKNKAEGEKHLQTLGAYFEKRLERARRFVWSLTVPLPENHPIFIVFGGACTLTPARMIVEEVDGEFMVRMSPDEISQPLIGVDYDALLLEPGDGSVTKASLLGRNVLDPSVKRHKYSFFPLDHAIFLCEKHNSLTGNVNFQDNLLNELLSRD